MHILIEILKKYFENRSEIAFAFLYGSQARGQGTRLSDIDIALYFYPKRRRPLEFEEEVFFETEDEIWSDLETLLKKDIELLILNRVSSCVAASALRGTPIIINDWELYLEFMEVVTSEAEDFMDLIINGYKEKTALEKRD